MKELKINVPKGYEIDKNKSTFKNIVFKEINKLPSSWEDLKEVEGYYVDSISDIWERSLTSFHKENTFKTEEQAEASIALAQLSQLRDLYRQGWEPDWNDNEEKYKYCIIFFNEKIQLSCSSHYHNFLSFQDKETAELFLKNFHSLIEKAKPLMS